MRSLTTSGGESILKIEVDKRSHVPVYVQISDAIRGMIVSGELSPDSVLPPSNVVCEKFGITHMTLRQAYTVLEREGLIDPQRGRGTYVRLPRIARTLGQMIGFSEEMQSRGKVPSSRVLIFEQRSASEAASQFLGDNPVYRLRRVRLGDGVPVAIEEAEILTSLCPGLERFDFTQDSLYKVLEQTYQWQFSRSEQQVTAAIPTSEERELLEIGTRVALLVVSRQTRLSGDRPAMFGTARYRGDLYTASVCAEGRPLR